MLRTLLFGCCLTLVALTGCDDEAPTSSTFEIGPDGEYPIPGLGFDGEVTIAVRHVGYEPRVNPDERRDDPSIGNLRVLDDDSTLAEDMLMFEGEALRFNFDDTTFELIVDAFDVVEGEPEQARATLIVERL